MTEDERRLFDAQATYVGPAIHSSRPLLDEMKPMPLCVVCPSARWYRMTDEKGVHKLECFCTEFRGLMYGARRDPVTACDARTDAMDRLKPTTAQPN